MLTRSKLPVGIGCLPCEILQWSDRTVLYVCGYIVGMLTYLSLCRKDYVDIEQLESVEFIS
jgi:hypothetical protein